MATEDEFWGRPLAPSPVKVDPNKETERARVVREALKHLATDPALSEELPRDDRFICLRMSHKLTDKTLAHLGRLLKG